MKTQVCAARGISSVLLIVLTTLAMTGCSPRQDQPQDLSELLSGMKAYSQDLTNRGMALPLSVSLDELVSRGYVSSNSVRAFGGIEARVWFGISETQPQKVVMSARQPDGTVNAVLGDGSVQEFSAQRFAEHLKQTGQQDVATNRSLPIAR